MTSLPSTKRLPVCIAVFLSIAAAFAQINPPQTPQPPKGKWMDKALSPDGRADLVLAEMSLDEKIQLVHGAGFALKGATDPSIVRSNGGGGFVPGIERLGLPDLNMDDSTLGVGGGAHKGRYSTALPSALALASSWDLALAREYGSLVGRELANQGYNVSLSGGVDITREPRNGRNFEYQGEDPILAGNMVAHFIQGLQGQGIIGDIKHYAVNDEETGRYFSNSVIDKRAMRESDLLAFEIGVKKAHPGMVMCSYNLINGVYACENDYTLNQILKGEWGFQGWVVSDWGGTHSTQKAALAGLDQEQPGFDFFGPSLKTAVEKGDVPLSRLNDMVHRILRTEFAIGTIDNPPVSQVPDVVRGLAIAQKVEEQSAVLLKNASSQLPLNASAIASIAVIGSHADVAVLSGGGSAQVDPPGGNAVPQPATVPGDLNALLTTEVWDPSSPLEAIRRHAPRATVTFSDGSDPKAAAKLAAHSSVALVFLHQHTHEGNDVPSLALPDGQDKLVEAVAAANPRTVVVLETGGPVLMPWINRVSAALESWYPGLHGGEAIANLLFGDANPSGKLAVTFPRSEVDLPRPKLPAPPGPIPGPLDGAFSVKPPYDIHYTEGLEVGYKWFDAEKKDPLFPFGFGLSYTSFEYSDLKVGSRGSLKVSLRVKNIGARPGAEIAQVYLAFPSDAGEPPKRLIAWDKIQLAPGESKTVSLTIDPLYFSIYDPDQNRWVIPVGECRVLAGSSSRDLPLAASVRLPSNRPARQ